MAKIGIYNEPSAGGLGGSEYAIAIIAEALAKVHQVEIVTHRPGLTAEELQEFAGVDLSSVTLRYVEPEHYEPIFARSLQRRYHDAKAWHAALSEPYDLFLCSLHGLPPFCHAAKGVLFVLFPFVFPTGLGDAPGMSPRRLFSKAYYGWEWKRRMDSYQLKLAISDFTRRWTERRWGIQCGVSNVPVDTDFRIIPKANTILSVGRFSLPGEGHAKKQKEMLATFTALQEPAASDWRYLSVGTVAHTTEHLGWFETLGQLAAGYNAELKANVGRDELKKMFETARIFWHAAGYGEDENAHPELTEHFGIATVEAMAAGCVPVVIRKGGQPEIVEHGVSGYLWDTLDELKQYTELLIENRELLQSMSEAARRRADRFSSSAFIAKFMTLLKPLLS